MSRCMDKMMMDGGQRQDIVNSHHGRTDDQVQENSPMKRSQEHTLIKTTPYKSGCTVRTITSQAEEMERAGSSLKGDHQ